MSIANRTSLVNSKLAEWAAPTAWKRIALREAALWLNSPPGVDRLITITSSSGSDVLDREPDREETTCP